MKVLDCTGIVLAGGQSRRMGQDKGLMLLNDKALVQYAAEVLTALCKEVKISANKIEYQQFGLPVFTDDVQQIGPMGGIASAFKNSDTTWIALLPCDMPYMTSELYAQLFRNLDADTQIITFGTTDRPYPLCSLYRRDVYTEIEKMITEKVYKMQDLLKRCRTQWVALPPGLERAFSNLNTPEEYTCL